MSKKIYMWAEEDDLVEFSFLSISCSTVAPPIHTCRRLRFSLRFHYAIRTQQTLLRSSLLDPYRTVWFAVNIKDCSRPNMHKQTITSAVSFIMSPLHCYPPGAEAVV